MHIRYCINPCTAARDFHEQHSICPNAIATVEIDTTSAIEVAGRKRAMGRGDTRIERWAALLARSSTDFTSLAWKEHPKPHSSNAPLYSAICTPSPAINTPVVIINDLHSVHELYIEPELCPKTESTKIQPAIYRCPMIPICLARHLKLPL